MVGFPGALIPACSALGSSSHRFILRFVVPQASARDGNHRGFPLICLWFLVKEGVQMAAHCYLYHILNDSQEGDWFFPLYLLNCESVRTHRRRGKYRTKLHIVIDITIIFLSR